MPETPDTLPPVEQTTASPSQAASFALIDVDPDFHFPARRGGALNRLLVALRILPQTT
ncbi:MAG: hypothetical protein JSS74_09010 [Actinobacteria bacterium]|nr:hypothetical protein [Actinomycetota bacterium]